MKRIITVTLALLMLAVSLSACGTSGSKRYDYDLDEYIELEQWDKIRAPFADPTVCTEEEIDDALFQVMLSYAEYSEKSDGVVEEYDKAVVDYSIYHDGKELEEYAQEEYGIVIGYGANGDVDAALAKELLGKKVGDFCKASHTFPKDDYTLGSWAGVTVEVQGTILGIYKSIVPECTDEFAKSLGDYGFTSVQDFRASLKKDILSQKEEAKKQIVMDTFLGGATVKKYPDAELKSYMERYIQEMVDAAAELEMEYEDYLAEYLQTTVDEVNEAAKNDSKERIRGDMACIQASRLLKVELSKKEYEEGLQIYYEQEAENFDSVEAFEEYYTKDFMWECVRWDKTFRIMLENAVSTLE